MDFISIGPVPNAEPCVQLGHNDYLKYSRMELQVYINQLKREYGPTAICRLSSKSFPHEFGTYHEIVIWYDATIDASVEEAYKYESGCDEWDNIAKKELTDLGYDFNVGK